MADQDHYTTLCVGRTSTVAEIKTAYNQLVLIAHPDKGGDQETFIKIRQAWEVLRDPKSRARYDKELLDKERSKARHATEGNQKPAAGSQKARGFTARPQQEAAETTRQQGLNTAANDADMGPGRTGRPRGSTAVKESEGEFKYEFTLLFRDSTFESRPGPRDRVPRQHCDHAAPKNCDQPAPNKNYDQGSPKECDHCPDKKCENQPQKQYDQGLPTLEHIKNQAQSHYDQFDYALAKLGDTFIRDASYLTELWPHLRHLRQTLSTRVLVIAKAEYDHSLFELHQGLKEGSSKSADEILRSFVSQINRDHEDLKVVAGLMNNVYDLAKAFFNQRDKRDSDRYGAREKLEAAVRFLQKFTLKIVG